MSTIMQATELDGKGLEEVKILTDAIRTHQFQIQDLGKRRKQLILRLRKQRITYREIAENSYKRKIIGFDAFGAFPLSLSAPEEDRLFVDRFSIAGGDGLSLDEMQSIVSAKSFTNVHLFQGNVMESLPAFLQNNQHTRISLVNLDLDVYEPTLFVLKTVWHRVMPGGIVVIDDYNSVSGATQAVDDFLDSLDVRPRLSPSPFNFYPAYIVKQVP